MNGKHVLLALSILPVLLLAACSNGTGNNITVKAPANTEPIGTVQQPEFYYVGSEDGSIRKFNAKNDSLTDTIQTAGLVHNLQVSPDGKMLAVTLGVEKIEHSDNHLRGTILFYDTTTDQLIKQVSAGSHPAYTVFTNDGKYALVTNSEDDNVAVIDMESYRIIRTIPTGSKPTGLQVSKDDKYAYVANMGDNTVSVVDLKNFQVVNKFKVGEKPVMTGITGDGKTLVVTLNGENSLATIDVTTGELHKIPVGKGPVELWVQADDQSVFVANQGTQQTPSATVTKVDVKHRKAVSTIQTGKGAHGLSGSTDGKIYVTNMFANTVSVIDTTNNQVVQTFEVGRMPNGITVK